jgi:hypothetical protein
MYVRISSKRNREREANYKMDIFLWLKAFYIPLSSLAWFTYLCIGQEKAKRENTASTTNGREIERQNDLTSRRKIVVHNLMGDEIY